MKRQLAPDNLFHSFHTFLEVAHIHTPSAHDEAVPSESRADSGRSAVSPGPKRRIQVPIPTVGHRRSGTAHISEMRAASRCRRPARPLAVSTAFRLLAFTFC